MNFRSMKCVWALAALLALPAVLPAQVAPERRPDIAEKEFRHGDLEIPAFHEEMRALPLTSSRDVRGSLNRMGVEMSTARVDRRSGRFSTLFPTVPLLPGNGVGNSLTWDAVGKAAPADSAALEQAAWDAFSSYLEINAAELGINLAEFGVYRTASHSHGEKIQIHAERQFDGIPVRGSHVSATISHGNLILLSAEQWGDRPEARRPKLNARAALEAAEDYLSPVRVNREWGKPELIYVPMARGHKRAEVAFGQGYDYRLMWTVKVNVLGDIGNWELLVDAQTGKVMANEDQNHYAEAKGGVYPVTNDGIVPDGVEQPGWPMPWLNVSTSSGTQTTDTGGNLSATGSLTASLTGPYVRMNDNCGSSSLTQTDNLDFGTSGGDDCTTPGFGGAGNTHSSRSGFYELNRIKETARAQLPSNNWLTNQLTSNMNINSTCNAFWNGSTVNFYRSGGGCSNTGEIAGVFVHEWGHGMDANDVNGGIASPSGEGIADIYTALRLNDSCIGRNFRTTPCTGFGDPCLTCTGVRDIDYQKRQSGNPHTYTWSNANCSGSVHCVGSVYSEAVWSLWKRELQAAPYNMNTHTAHELVTRLTYIAAGATSTWFSGGPPFGGCSGSSGYNNYLAADDDNGNLNDGTPHMTAIYNAFNAQEIACSTPTVQDSGCAGTPTTAPNVTATSADMAVSLSWGSVSGASTYGIYRAEGIFGCDFGKVKVGEISGTSFSDTGLQNGRDYSYVVIPMGSGGDTCMGPASACDTVQPAGAPPTPDFSVSCTPSSQSVQQGANAISTCTVTALNGYTGSVNLSCSGAPAGVSCGFSPATVSATGNSTLTMSVALSQSVGTFNFDVVGNDGTDTRSTGVNLTVTPEGQNGPQDAVYDSGLGAPRCSTPGSSCDSTTLLDSRGTLSPAEPNQPNTLDTCTDGSSGTYHSDESNDRVVVSTLDGFDFTEGATVQVDVTVWGWNTGTSDSLDLYYAADATNPSWTLITTIDLTSGGAQTLSAQYTLPSGALQAVRANFRYNGSPSTCGGGNYDDTDDLVFAVNTAGNTAPSVNITAPTNGSSFTTGTSVSFSGTASDTEDGDLTGSLSWSSSLDGAIGSGGSFSTSGLSEGSHTITASVTDSGSLSGSDAITVTITPPANNAPSVSITAPSDGSSFVDGTSVSFTGTASDTEDGDLTASLSWSSNLDGAIGTGGSFSTSSLSVGSHTITASVTDSGSLSGSDSVSLTITPVGGGCNDCIDWSTTTTVSYSNQDSSANFTVEDGGDTLLLEDNTWRRTTQTWNVTANTVIEVEFSSNVQGEIHGIGFDENDTLTDNVRIFQMHGTQTWTSANQDFNNYSGGGSFVTYTIPVGQYYTGSAMYLVVVNDNDAGSGNDSRFRNVRVYEDTPPPGSCAADVDFSAGASGWTNSGSCSTGTFVAATPTEVVNGGVTTQLAGDHTTGAGNAWFTATNSSAGVNDVDGGTCITTSPVYSVTENSDVSVWYFHGQRDAGDDAGDFFSLEISVDGGSTWSTMASFGDVTVNAAWAEATTTVSAGDSVQFRMQAADGTADGDLVEAGIDDVSICPTP